MTSTGQVPTIPPQPAGSEVVLKAEGIEKSYDDNSVLRGVSLEVQRGKVTAILGSSGSGKSTLLRCCALLEPPDAGRIYLEGQSLGTKMRRGREVRVRDRELCKPRSQIGMVFQSFNLFPHLTATQNVMAGLVEVRGVDKSSAREQAVSFLRRVGLGERVDAFPDELSGGQQQRVAIARALVMRPKAMLFDEPTSALDPELVREVLDVIEGLAKDGMTMLIVTHELAFARRVADEVVLMFDGVIVEAAPPEQFFDRPQHERTRRFLSFRD